MVRGYETEKDVKMRPGDTVDAGGYGFRLEGFQQRQGPNYQATVGEISVLVGGSKRDTLYPEKRFYTATQMSLTEAAIDIGVTRDLYVSLGEPVEDGSWIVRIYHKPFIDWIWGGGFIMALGGLLAATDRRYRLARREAAQAAPGVVATG